MALLVAALLPAASMAMGSERSGSLVEICSAAGARFVMLPSDDGGDAGQGKSSGATNAMNCPYCAIHHGAPYLPPSVLTWQPPSSLRFTPPVLFLQAPRPLFAWAPSLARGPPLQR